MSDQELTITVETSKRFPTDLKKKFLDAIFEKIYFNHDLHDGDHDVFTHPETKVVIFTFYSEECFYGEDDPPDVDNDSIPEDHPLAPYNPDDYLPDQDIEDPCDHQDIR